VVCVGGARGGVSTVESLDAPHVVLGNGSLAGEGGVGVHQRPRVAGVPQAKSMTDLMSCYLNQVIQPHTWGERHRHTQREKERERERQRDRERDRETERERQTDRQTAPLVKFLLTVLCCHVY